jgi:hypothetical protein
MLRTDKDPRAPLASSMHDILSIHFSLQERTRDDLVHYSGLVTEDLLTRELSASGNLQERRDRLRESFVIEYTYRHLKGAIAHGSLGKENALFHLIDAVPCILHMENRIGLKFITMLAIKGLGNAKRALTFSQERSEGKRIEKFFERLQFVFNCEIWGTPESPTHWECPYDKQEKIIGIICLDNGRTRRIVNSIETVIDVCLSDKDVESIIWKQAITEYRKGFEILRRKQDLSDEEISQFQLHMDKFFSDWIKVNKGDAGVTNYIHLLGAGHVSDYLFFHRNLYIHSQQGWESFNSMLKTFYFRATARGGTRWGKKSRLIPIPKWLQRRMMWMLGIPFEEMEQYVKDKNLSVEPDDSESSDNDE